MPSLTIPLITHPNHLNLNHPSDPLGIDSDHLHLPMRNARRGDHFFSCLRGPFWAITPHYVSTPLRRAIPKG